MKEIEIKVIEVDKKDLEKKLKRIGAKKVFDGESYSIIYDFQNRSLQKNKKILRLRKEGKKVFITLKKKIHEKKAKVADEYEVDVNDFNMVDKIFEHMGLTKKEIFPKKRVSYKLGKVKFEFDKNPGIPWFMEIEASNIKTIYDYCKKLGIDKKDIKTWHTKQIYAHYKR